MSGRRARGLLVASSIPLILAIVPGPASATSVARLPPDERGKRVEILIRGDDGANRVRVKPGGRYLFTVSDSSGMKAGAGCEQASPTTVTCQTDDYGIQIEADLLAGDDSFRIKPEYYRGSTIDGGAGRDTLPGGGSRDRIEGGPGRDMLRSVPGDGDQLFGGPGADLIRGSGDRDFLSGGAGADRLLGEGGNDVLWADDGHEDRAIAGGDGDKDVAYVDRADSRRDDSVETYAMDLGR
jgi:Ca2+-binding RTX toxin-like protein